MFTLIILIAVFVILSGFFAMIDAAVLSVSPAEAHEMAHAKKWGAASLVRIQKHLTRTIIVIVILTNITNVAFPVIIGQVTESVFGNQEIGMITAVLAFLTIIFSEILPKAIGAHYAPAISRGVAPFIRILIVILYPLVRIFEAFARLFKKGKRDIGTEAQIRALVSIGEDAGHINQEEEQLIERAFVLNDKKTRDMMTPHHKIVALSSTTTVRVAAKAVFQHSYSRYPVYRGTMDTIIGQALSRDILEELADGKDTDIMQNIMREVLVVSPNMKANKLLALFRKKQIHLAVVQEEGKTIGIISLEDVLEELVGEIEDEGDTA